MNGRDSVTMERKIISVTGKRQITIPLRFYEKLRFGKEVECLLTDDAVVLRPLSSSDESLTMEILIDLVSQGYNGDQLLEKFAEQRSNIKKVVDILIEETDEIAVGKNVGIATQVNSEVKPLSQKNEEAGYVRPAFQFGCLKGVLKIDDDFSDVLADFKEYM